MNAEPLIYNFSFNQQEALLLSSMVEAAMEQYESASFEERQDADLQAAYAIWSHLHDRLPRMPK